MEIKNVELEYSSRIIKPLKKILENYHKGNRKKTECHEDFKSGEKLEKMFTLIKLETN
jgi:hypothetical protein